MEREAKGNTMKEGTRRELQRERRRKRQPNKQRERDQERASPRHLGRTTQPLPSTTPCTSSSDAITLLPLLDTMRQTRGPAVQFHVPRFKGTASQEVGTPVESKRGKTDSAERASCSRCVGTMAARTGWRQHRSPWEVSYTAALSKSIARTHMLKILNPLATTVACCFSCSTPCGVDKPKAKAEGQSSQRCYR